MSAGLRRIAGDLGQVGLTLALLLLLIAPTLWILIASLRTPEAVFGGLGGGITLANFVELLEGGFAIFLFNSLKLCALAVLATTVVAVPAAYVFSRARWRGKRILFGAVLLGQCFPWVILVTPVFILFARLGLLNSHLSLALVYVAIALPFSIYLLVGYLESIPREIDEAAILDGCSPVQVIVLVVLPLMLPGIVATATYAFLLCWSEYLFAVALLTETGQKTMPLALYTLFGEDVTEWGQVMAASTLMTLPTLLLFLPLQRHLTGGLAAGAIRQ